METTQEQTVRLTQLSHGGGCGCKIAPNILEEILSSELKFAPPHNLVVGNSSKDDAAVYDMGDGTGIISTVDFFTPIVDDPFDYGRIASANAISDVYAMGGKPLMAIAILGWPVEKLSTSIAQKVLEGSRTICALAGIPMAGGHSIDSPEPIFGLSVTGTIPIKNVKKNNTAKEGDLLFLTKPLGVGILSTAQKKGALKPEHLASFIDQLIQLNKVGEALGKCDVVTAMTDVTGFGLSGHLIEMGEGSGLSAEIYYSRGPVHENAREYLAQRLIPDATYRNWNSCSKKISFEKGVNVMEAFSILPDPQTNGGLLIAVDPAGKESVQKILADHGYLQFLEPIGKFTSETDKRVVVKV